MVVLAIFSIVFIYSKTSFAETDNNTEVNNKGFKSYAKYKNEIEGFLFPEDLLKFKFTDDNLVYYYENGGLDWSHSSFKKGDKYILVSNGLVTKNTNWEKSMFYGVLFDDIKNSTLKKYKEINLNIDSLDKVVLLQSHNSDEYVFCAANKIKDEDYSFITIISINRPLRKLKN